MANNQTTNALDPNLCNDVQVRIYFLTAPLWVLGAIVGLVSGFLVGLVARFDIPLTWSEAVVGGALIGSLLGVALVSGVHRLRRQLHTAAGDIPTEALTTAHRAAGGGPIPADPNVRAAALKIATQRLLLLRRLRPMVVVFITGLVVSTTLNMLFDGFELGTLVPIVVGAGTIGFGWFWPRRLRDRIRQLAGDVKTAAP